MKFDFLDKDFSSVKSFEEEESELKPKSILRDIGFQIAPTFNVGDSHYTLTCLE